MSPSLRAALHPLTTDANGNIFMLGQSYDGTFYNVVTVKLTPSGSETWRATLQSSDPASARAITTDAAGNVYVAASAVHVGAPGQVGANYLIVKYDAGGSEVWRRSTNVSPSMNATPSAITADTAGNVYVTGGSNNFPQAGDFFTLKYAPDGTELWRAVTAYGRGAMAGDRQRKSVSVRKHGKLRCRIGRQRER